MIVTLQQSKDGTFQYDERARRSHRRFRRWAMALVSLLLLAGCGQKDWPEFSAGRPCVKMTDIPGGGPFQPSSMYFCGDDANRYLVRQDGSFQVMK